MTEKAISHDAEKQELDTEEFDPNSLAIQKVRRRVDFRLIPLLAFLYLLSFLDRVNIGNAKVAGLEKDVKITPAEYNWALSIFFVGYIIAEIPSNLILKKIGPPIWISGVMVTWGGVTMALAACKDAPSLLATRFFLGLAEAGLFPGAVYMISLWYTRGEIAVRNGFFFSTATLSGAFGGILAYGIAHMEGILGIKGWQWIFIIEGGITVVVGFLTYFLLPELPEKAKFLSEEEREIVLQRLRVDAGPATETHFSWNQCRMAFKDPNVYIFLAGYVMGAISVFGLAFFVPSIVLGFGYGPVVTQIMTAPAYTIACIVTICCAFSSDHHRERGIHTGVSCFVASLGYILLILTRHQAALPRYVALTITLIGAFSSGPAYFAWFSGNIGGHTKRGVSIAFIISIGSVGGAIGSQIFRAEDAPYYVRGLTIGATLTFLSGCTAFLMKLKYIRENKRRDSLTPEQYEKEKQGEELCDLHPDYRYIT
jgi:MFS family permease